MPYSCTMLGGRPLLTAGPERGHRIVGQRDRRKFTACSPANPGMCRHWTVYRFDLDCDGTRVPWVEVVAAASEAGRSAWLADGRLQLRMTPRWSLAPDDPCAYEAGRDPFGDPRRRRQCAERLAQAPPAVVEMPLGFAPMLGIDAIFVKAAPNVATAPPPPKQPGTERPQPEAPPGRPTGEAFAKETPPAPPPPPPPSAAEAHAKTPPTPAGPPPAPKTPPVAAAGDPPPAAPSPKTAPPPADPKPSPKAAGPPPAPPAAEGPKGKSAAPDAAPKAAASPRVPAKKETAPAKEGAPSAKMTGAREDTPGGLHIFSFLRTTTTGIIVAFAGLTLGLLIAFSVARRRERLHHVGMQQRAKGRPRLGFDDGSEPPGRAVSTLNRVPGASAADAALAAWGDGMPRTRKEAFKVLGMGIAPGANALAVKKIVDALRVSWHPDLARDEPDRQLRELRSKQINAAWELLQGERAEV
jgi:hypothetical protein